MAKREAKVVDLSQFRDLDIKSFAMVPTNGDDMVFAAERVIPPSGGMVDPNLFNLLLRQQLVAGSITEVDGQPVKGKSCQASVQWNSRTREFVGRTFDYMNEMTKDERDLFEKVLAGDAPSASTPAVSPQT